MVSEVCCCPGILPISPPILSINALTCERFLLTYSSSRRTPAWRRARASMGLEGTVESVASNTPHSNDSWRQPLANRARLCVQDLNGTKMVLSQSKPCTGEMTRRAIDGGAGHSSEPCEVVLLNTRKTPTSASRKRFP